MLENKGVMSTTFGPLHPVFGGIRLVSVNSTANRRIASLHSVPAASRLSALCITSASDTNKRVAHISNLTANRGVSREVLPPVSPLHCESIAEASVQNSLRSTHTLLGKLDSYSEKVNTMADVNAVNAPEENQPTYEQLKAQLAAMEAANKAAGRTLFPVTLADHLYSKNGLQVVIGSQDKGNLSIFGMMRFPVTLYRQQVEAIGNALFGLTAEQIAESPIGKWITLHDNKLTKKAVGEDAEATPEMVAEAFRLTKSKDASEQLEGKFRLNTYGVGPKLSPADTKTHATARRNNPKLAEVAIKQ